MKIYQVSETTPLVHGVSAFLTCHEIKHICDSHEVYDQLIDNGQVN